MASFKIVIHKNEGATTGIPFVVESKWSFSQFKTKAGETLKIKAKRVFLNNGSEIDGIDEISANQHVYFSSGEDFYKSKDDPLRSGGSTKTKFGKDEKIFVSVLGTGGVGKSAISLRFCRDYFVENWDPTIEDAYVKNIEVDDQPCVIDILDTAGQDDFESLRTSWMIDKDGYLFVYSLAQPQSLDELKSFIDLHHQINEKRKVRKKNIGGVGGLITNLGEHYTCCQ